MRIMKIDKSIGKALFLILS